MSTKNNEGERRRDAALYRARCRQPLDAWRAQLAMLTAMRGRPDRLGTSDDCTPSGERYSGNAPWLGAAVRSLAKRSLIVRVGTARSTRPTRKANEVKLWRLRDDAAADAAITTLRRVLDAHRPSDNSAQIYAEPSLFNH